MDALLIHCTVNSQPRNSAAELLCADESRLRGTNEQGVHSYISSVHEQWARAQ